MKSQNYKDFVVKKYIYGNLGVVLHHLELLISTEKLQILTMLFHSQGH